MPTAALLCSALPSAALLLPLLQAADSIAAERANPYWDPHARMIEVDGDQW